MRPHYAIQQWWQNRLIEKRAQRLFGVADYDISQ